MDLQELFVRPVDGDPDLYAFRFDFIPEGKAVDAPVVQEQENGDLIIEGYAAVFEGQDRQDENFIDKAFQRGIKAFLGGQASLCYHHKHDLCLGKVLELEEEEGKGLRMRARVDGAIRSHPVMGTYYEQIKKGTLNALSVGGFFRRKMTEAGRKIAACDLTEISVTPVPVHPGTNFAVVAGKALKDMPQTPEGVESGEIRASDEEQINFMIDQLNEVFANIERGLARRRV
jgi:HK97 family phage prohead protease